MSKSMDSVWDTINQCTEVIDRLKLTFNKKDLKELLSSFNLLQVLAENGQNFIYDIYLNKPDLFENND